MATQLQAEAVALPAVPEAALSEGLPRFFDPVAGEFLRTLDEESAQRETAERERDAEAAQREAVERERDAEAAQRAAAERRADAAQVRVAELEAELRARRASD